MRDGIRLFTAIYIPKDTSVAHPFLMTRTPYSCSPYGEKNYSPFWQSEYQMKLARLNYIFVFQDVRGRYMSEGKFEDVRPFNKNKNGKKRMKPSDTYDAIELACEKYLPTINGKVAVTRNFLSGFLFHRGRFKRASRIGAVSPQAPVTDWFLGMIFTIRVLFS